jgi:hypothetical protein
MSEAPANVIAAVWWHSHEAHTRKPVQTATVMESSKKARTMNGNAQRVVAVVSYLMTTTAERK